MRQTKLLRGKKTITSFDVARRARVSRTTVSFVMNDVVDAKISAVTRARVLKAARALGYFPNASGKALAQRKTENIALVYTRSYHHIACNSILLRNLRALQLVLRASSFTRRRVPHTHRPHASSSNWKKRQSEEVYS